MIPTWSPKQFSLAINSTKVQKAGETKGSPPNKTIETVIFNVFVLCIFTL